MLDIGLDIALGTALDDIILLGNKRGKILGVGTEFGTDFDLVALLGTELDTTLDTALGGVVSLDNELGNIPGFGTELETESGDVELHKQYRQLDLLYSCSSFFCCSHK